MAVADNKDAGEYVSEHYRKVAARWRERVTDSAFMQQLTAGTLPREALRTFFKNWGSYTIEINTVEAASYHKHIAFFRKHRDLMARMAEKLADELIHPKPPGHVHVVLETAKALGIAEDEIFLAPMLAEFRAKLDFKRSLLWEGTMAEFYAAGATEEQTGYWSADFYKALTTHYGLSKEQAVYFSTHEEADLKEHDGVMGHGSFRRLVLKTLIEDGLAQTRPGYTLEYCGLTAVAWFARGRAQQVQLAVPSGGPRARAKRLIEKAGHRGRPFSFFYHLAPQPIAPLAADSVQIER